MITPPSAVRDTQEDTGRSGDPTRRRIFSYGYVRCECQRCGTHLNALAVGERVMGVCSNCDGTLIAPVTA